MKEWPDKPRSPCVKFIDLCVFDTQGSLAPQGFYYTRAVKLERERSLTSTRRLHAKLEILLRVLDRILHELLKLSLHILQTSDILPVGVGSLDNGLTEGRRRRLAHGELRMKRSSWKGET